MQLSLKIVPVLALLLPGCMPVDPGFGETHRANIERQVVDPDPQYADVDVEGGNGERSAAAVTRYQQGQVTQPVVVSTQTSASGSGGTGPN